MSQLETAMVMVMDVFEKYACVEGNKNTLTKAETKCLLEKELPGIMKGAKGKDDCDKLLKDLDENGDSEIDFKEFIIFVASLTCLVHDKLVAAAKK